jgi:hypothetical protein
VRSAAASRRQASSGSSSTLAPAARTKTSASGPNSGAPTRMNRNDAPHSAASSSNSRCIAKLHVSNAPSCCSSAVLRGSHRQNR